MDPKKRGDKFPTFSPVSRSIFFFFFSFSHFKRRLYHHALHTPYLIYQTVIQLVAAVAVAVALLR